MKEISLSRRMIASIVIIWWAIFVYLVIDSYNPFNILNIIVFSFLIFVPGILTVYMIKRKQLPLWGYIGLAIGFSIFELMSVGLVCNMVLPYFGVTSPLSTVPLLIEISILFFILLFALCIRCSSVVIASQQTFFFENHRDVLLGFLPSIFVVLSVFGAIRLNNGGDGMITYVMLVSMSVYMGVLAYYSKKVGENVIPTAFFFISLSLLFMTSLRGWYITGHDVQREFHVFELAKNAGIWNIDVYKDAYNACMSITILPTIFANLLKISDQYVYKILFQIIFATIPSIIYLSIRRYTSALIALLSALYFVSFPTFFNDMPMLNRQEIAFLFLALMVYIIFDNEMALRVRRNIFVWLGFGMILSHYSTTYTVLALLIFLIVARPLLVWIGNRIKKTSTFSESGIMAFNAIASKNKQKKLITVWMVIVLMLSSFFWTSIVTGTSSNSLYRVIGETITAMRNNVKSDAQSTDVTYNLFSWHQTDPTQEFKDYQKKIVESVHNRPQDNIYYSQASYSQYAITPVSESVMNLTSIGNTLKTFGFNVVSFNYIFRQLSGKILQILIAIGCLFVLFKKKIIEKPFDTEFTLLSFGSIVFVLAIVVLPVLSVEYGLLRAFEQSLIFLSVFIVIGSIALVTKVGNNKQAIFASVLAILFFLSNTGVITQTLGGYGPQMTLNNDGKYYDEYYMHRSEVISIKWLIQEMKRGNPQYQPELQADQSELGKIFALSSLHAINSIYPAFVQKNSFVYLGYTNINKQLSSVLYNSDSITYLYPLKFLDNNKNLIYNNGNVKIYK